MKCYCLAEFGAALSARDVPLPEPVGEEVLIKVQAAGVCHSDLHISEGGYDLGGGRRLMLKDRGIDLPITMGHETAGVAVRAGPGAKGVALGGNYLVYPWIGCGHCDTCLAGRENECAAPACLGIHRPGGYAEYVLVPNARYLIDIGDLDPATAAPYACSGLTTYSALMKIGEPLLARRPIVIFGAGGLGLMCLQLIKALGGKGAIVVDLDPVKRQAALDAGALAVVDGSQPDVASRVVAAAGEPLAAAIDLVGAPDSTAAAFDCLMKGGKLVIVGLFGGASSWSIAMIPLKAVTIVGNYVGNLEELRALMKLVSAHKVAPIPVTRYPLAQADAVLKALRDGKVTGRAVLTP